MRHVWLLQMNVGWWKEMEPWEQQAINEAIRADSNVVAYTWSYAIKDQEKGETIRNTPYEIRIETATKATQCNMETQTVRHMIKVELPDDRQAATIVA